MPCSRELSRGACMLRSLGPVRAKLQNSRTLEPRQGGLPRTYGGKTSGAEESPRLINRAWATLNVRAAQACVKAWEQREAVPAFRGRGADSLHCSLSLSR